MPLQSYGVLIGQCAGSERDSDPTTPHLSVYVTVDGKRNRAAVNVKSKLKPSELVYCHAPQFVHPVTALLKPMTDGFHALASTPTSGALDFIRGNLFPLEEAVALPADLPGLDNDLCDIVESLVRRATAEPGARIFIFGEPFPDGIHDIHMNQGNSGSFVRDDGVWQDGGMMVYSPSLDRWSAVFLAFQSQALHTNDRTGHTEPGARTFEDVVKKRPASGPVTGPTPGTTPIPDSGQLPVSGQRDGLVRIVSAMVNPTGSEGQPGFAGEGEWVQLLSLVPEPLDLSGWAILNRTKAKSVIASGTTLPAAGFLRIAMDKAVPLSNGGGLITLVDAQGLKVDGVSYTAEQARREGWPIGF